MCGDPVPQLGPAMIRIPAAERCKVSNQHSHQQRGSNPQPEDASLVWLVAAREFAPGACRGGTGRLGQRSV